MQGDLGLESGGYPSLKDLRADAAEFGLKNTHEIHVAVFYLNQCRTSRETFP